MRKFPYILRLALCVSLALGPVGGSALAQSGPPVTPVQVQETPWQQVITGQIEAFRADDATAALSYAGASFQVAFPDPTAFLAAINNSGYAPIRDSRSHSFGAYQTMGTAGVIQEVRFVGKDQDLYIAVYQMTLEEPGWRVQGVQLVRQPGIAI